MDARAFEAWLGGIAGLSEAQRRQALQELGFPAVADIAEPVLPAPDAARAGE
jgi:hypothetical protein